MNELNGNEAEPHRQGWEVKNIEKQTNSLLLIVFSQQLLTIRKT